jgi:hypothetical protein
VSGFSEGGSCAEAIKGQKSGLWCERRFFAGFFFGFGIEAVRIVVRFDTGSGQGFFRFFAHIVGVLLGVEGAGVVDIYKILVPGLGMAQV